MKKQYSYFLIIFSLLLIPALISADGGMVIWPSDIYLEQTAQNAIVAWNEKEEIIILSNDIKSDAEVTALRIVPLPSDPSEIKEGDFKSFDKLVEIMNEKIETIRNQWLAGDKGFEGPPSAGIEITFQEKIGAHDITVVKIIDLDYFLTWVKDFANGKGLSVKTISQEFKEGIKNYLKRNIRYFVFDIINTLENKESIKPLIYKFKSDYLYYPILISGISEISESRAKIKVFFIFEEKILDNKIWHPYRQGRFKYPVVLTQDELKEVNEDIAGLFDSTVTVTSFDFYSRLNEFQKDLIFYPHIWNRNLTIGSSGKDVKTLQTILINEGMWDSDIEATGYFGSITEKAVKKFQEKNKYHILEPLGLKTGTGFFGSKTLEYLENSTYLLPLKGKIVTKWSRNLYLGASGNDVKELQEILIKEGIWERPDIEPTGYFGTITREAVIKFQEKYSPEILQPFGLIKGTGFVGSSTRAYLEKLISSF